MMRAALPSTLLLSILPLCTATPAGAVTDPPMASPTPMVVTTDTDAYCETLWHQIRQHADPLSAEVVSLRDQGIHLCATGQVRGGINRLRRALMILRDNDGGADGAPDDGQAGR